MGFIHQVSRHVNHLECHAFGSLIPNNGLVGNQIHHAFEMFFVPDRNLNRHGIGAQHVFDLLTNFEEVRSLTVHFVHKAQAGHFVIVGEAPIGFGLRFNAIHGREQENQTIQNAEGSVNLYGEIHVPRGINDVHRIFLVLPFPRCLGRSGGNGDPALLFLGHPVHGGGPIVDLPNFVGHPGIIENALCSRGFAGINMGCNSNIAGKA